MVRARVRRRERHLPRFLRHLLVATRIHFYSNIDLQRIDAIQLSAMNTHRRVHFSARSNHENFMAMRACDGSGSLIANALATGGGIWLS